MADFFEAVKRGIEKGVATVGAKSKEMIEVSQLRSQIRVSQEEKRAKLEELGNIVHVMLVRGTLDETRLREKSEAVAALEINLTGKEEQIRAIQVRTEEMIGTAGLRRSGQCSCGADLLEGAKFCGGCGKPAAPSVVPEDMEAGSAGQCAKCGHLSKPGARFCGACGTSL